MEANTIRKYLAATKFQTNSKNGVDQNVIL